MGPEMNYVGEKAVDPLTFAIYPDARGEARLSLYEDDGVSPAYRNGVFRRTTVSYQASGAGAEINVSAPAGSYQPGARNLVFAIRPAPVGQEALLDGNPAPGHRSTGAVSLQFADDSRPHKIQIQ